MQQLVREEYNTMSERPKTVYSNSTRIARNTMFLYLRSFITMMVALYTSRVVLTALGVEDFGIWCVLGGIVSMFGFLSSSLSSSVFRFFSHAIGAGDVEQLNILYSASFVIHLSLAVLVLFVCETMGQWFLAEKLVVPEAKREIAVFVFHLVILNSCISLLTVPFSGIIISYERMDVFAYVSIADAVMKLVIAYVVFYVQTNKLLWYAVLMFGFSAILLLFYYLYVRVQFRNLKFCRLKGWKSFKPLLGFSGWSLVGNLAYVGYTQGITLLLNVFFGPVVNASRAVSIQIEQTIRTFVGNFQTAINPQIIKKYAQSELDAMHLLIIRGSKFSLFVFFIFALPVLLETETILVLWLGMIPSHTVAFCRLMLGVISLEIVTSCVGMGIVATGNVKWLHVIVGTILLTIVPLSYFALKMGSSAETVFIVYLFVEIIAVLARLSIARKQIRFPVSLFLSKVIFRPFLIFLLASSLPVVLYFSIPSGIIRFVMVNLACFVTSITTIYFLGLDEEERQFVRQKVFDRFKNNDL